MNDEGSMEFWAEPPWKTQLPRRELIGLLLGALVCGWFSPAAAAILILIWLGRNGRHELAGRLSRRPPAAGDGRLLLQVFIRLTLINILLTTGWNLLFLLFGWDTQTEQEGISAIRAGNWPVALAGAAHALLIAPLAEELFFRRLLYDLLRPLGGWTAMAATATLFALAHNFLYGLPALLAMGIAFQYIYLRTGSFRLAVLLHMLVNLLALSVTLAGCWLHR